LFILLPGAVFGATNKMDTLLNTLDSVISNRDQYTLQKQKRILDLKQKKLLAKSTDAQINVNKEIIEEYKSFICDSAEFYINQNLAIAKKQNNQDLILGSSLDLSFIYSLSGLFLQASELFETLDYESLPTSHKAIYCWSRIRYYENLIFYTADTNFSKQYEIQKEEYRDKVMELLGKNSDEYKKELAHKLQLEGKYKGAIEILEHIFSNQQPGTHNYAMAAMNVAKAYKQAKNIEKEEYYLILAATTDIKLAVKENEALLSLAIILYDKGDVNRAYNYIRVALDDALFYNARFKNSVIARVQPIIEDTYLKKINYQQKNLRIYSILTSLFVIILLIALIFIYKQNVAVTKARKELRKANDDLIDLNHRLDEANIIKERYLGYFMNLCSVYVNKLHNYKKNVYLKVKTGQLDSFTKPSSLDLDKEIDELRTNFDKAFLKLYPNFVSELNSLLKPEERFELIDDGKLNTELRIFALIKLGITDVSQIADFLCYSVQTVYNYKSKVKGKSIIESDLFEEEVKKIGKLC
jgi:hypothetical protein